MVKRLLRKRVLFLAIPVVLVLAGGGFFLLGGAGAAPFVLNIVINQPANDASQAKEQHLTVSLGERVVNLADPGGYRYLKVEVVVEVAVDQKTYERLTAGGGGGHGSGGSGTDPLRAELDHSWPKIQDTLTLVLTSKTVDELSTSEGKERLKAELAEKLQPAFGEYQITEVYLTQFVIQ
ncbi:flagellar basal body-associated FliL family protein [Thermomicrobium sp. CFH 73360]|uniref:flagellar basal body-associated FliL family protein n=1 Tax=Thermomicrobium sp. CFH 73360 TaxID=2951987 RepID=UPI002077234C|nr:flagellar basal body-associated FliL family protein [Thermomicrobium sp. CFH 73360]MCM8746341.1 flagellar basal body-associated FliL family protein [Thermomicrobium sp. CFH 73360]